MCGIAGVLSRDARSAEEIRNVTGRMAARLAHRGPDHQGVWTDGQRIALANRRLAIVDLSPEGEQPMHAPSGRYSLVLNGEIYNFVELREELEAGGATFRGHADTEVLLAGIDRWGLPEAIDRAAGMFAIAVWDHLEQTLTLVRDRAGKKPLYVATADGVCYFASEIKALRDGARLSLSLDDASFDDYLSLGYVPGPRTIYREITQVPPGGWMVIDAALNRREHRYWRLPRAAATSSIDFTEAVEETNRRLTLAVSQRLRADVPVGAFLSGGIDSGIMTAIAARESATPIKTFTVVFEEGAFDEGPLAKLVVDRYRTDHHVIPLASTLHEMLPDVVRAYDVPMADPSAVPTFAVSKAAGRELKVVLNGEGADELFGGYRRALAARYAGPLAGALESWPWVSRLVDQLPNAGQSRSPWAFVRRTARGLGLGPLDRYLTWSSDGFTTAEKQALFGQTLSGTTATRLAASLGHLEGRRALDHFMAVDFSLSLVDCLLVKIDIATMAFSLEGRSPFLDHRVIEWAASLPRSVVFHGRGTKPILRTLATRYLPEPLVNAPKRGFEIPLVEWVRGPLRPLIRDLCLSQGGILVERGNRTAIEALIDGKTTLDPDRWARRLWTLLMVSAWDAWCRPEQSGEGA